MRLCEIASIQSWLPYHPTVKDPIWQREILAVSDGEIQLFYARSSLARLRQEAIDAIDALQASIICSAFNGDLREVPAALIMHELPPEPFFMDELVDGVNKLPAARGQACLFALESRQTPDAIANLTWKGRRGMAQLPALCAQILSTANQTRHLKLPYVFWEWATPQIAAPLLELQWTIEQAFDCAWPQLAQRYRNLAMTNRHQDAVSVLELISGNKR